MHPSLQKAIERTTEHFRTDERCLGLYLWGSLGKGTADAFSDLDLAIVVEDECFDAIASDLPSICERVCGPIRVWLPEGARDQFCNFAFLFEAGPELLLCDFSVMTRSFLAERRAMRPDRILYDPEGVLASVRDDARTAQYVPERLLPAIHEYWVYAYLNGKYWKRADVFKLLYVQNRLFQIHVQMLHALHPGAEWTWWPASIRHLLPEHQEELRVYFTAAEPNEIAASLRRALDLFSRDAQTASQAWDIPYPHALERSVRDHLRSMGLPIR